MAFIGIALVWLFSIVLGRGLVHALQKYLPNTYGQIALISIIRALFYAPTAPFGALLIPSFVYAILLVVKYPPNLESNPALFLFSVIVFIVSLWLGIANKNKKATPVKESDSNA